MACKTVIQRFLFVLLSVFIACGTAVAQDRIDRALDSYASICMRLAELRDAVRRGESVTRDEAASLSRNIERLRTELEAAGTEMTAAQKKRLKSIQRLYTYGDSSVPLPQVPAMPTAPAMFSSPCAIKMPGLSGNSPGVLNERGDYTAFALVSGSVWQNASVGLMAGASGDKLGAYVSVHAMPAAGKAVASVLSDGTTPEGGYLWTSGRSSASFFAACAGMVLNLNGGVGLYSGAGFGSSRLLWEKYEGGWAEVEDKSHRGVTLEGGLMWNPAGRVLLKAGVCTISFRSVVPSIGAGLRF